MSKRIVFTICTFLVCNVLWGAPHGIALCLAVENILTNAIKDADGKNVAIARQNLITSSDNFLPYNVLVTIGSDKRKAATTVIAFQMEDVLLHRADIEICVAHLAEHGAPCQLLFSYGDIAQTVMMRSMSGTFAYVRDASEEDTAALCISWFSADGKTPRVQVISGGGGGMTKAGLLRRSCTALTQAMLPYTVVAGGFGALYRFGWINDTRLDERVATFIRAGVTACGLRFPDNTVSDTISQVLLTFAVSKTIEAGGSHYIAFHTNKRFFIVGEEFIVVAFIVAAFFCILIVCLPHTMRQKQAFLRIIRALHVLPTTMILVCLSFMAGQWAARMTHYVIGASLMGQFCIKIATAFFIVTMMYLVIVHFSVQRQDSTEIATVDGTADEERKGDDEGSDVYRYNEETYCYLLIVISLLNLVIFSAIDISLVFLFATEYAIVAITRHSHSLPFIVFSLIWMCMPYVPYFSFLSLYAESAVFVGIVYASLWKNALFAMIFVPFLIQWLRILSRISGRTSSTVRRRVMKTLFTVLASIAMFAFPVLVRGIRRASAAKIAQKAPIKMIEMQDNMLKCSVTDNDFFGDVLRTISINTGKECIEVVTEVCGKVSSTIVYCDDFYTTDADGKTDTFRVPSFPPAKLSFSYSADGDQDATVTVTAIYALSSDNVTAANDNVYELRRVVIPVEAHR